MIRPVRRANIAHARTRTIDGTLQNPMGRAAEGENDGVFTVPRKRSHWDQPFPYAMRALPGAEEMPN